MNPTIRCAYTFALIMTLDVGCGGDSGPKNTDTSAGQTKDSDTKNDSADSASGHDTDDSGTADPKPDPDVSSWIGEVDYGFLFWPGNHWTSWGTYDDVEHIQTGTYGVALDVSSANLDHFGLITDPEPVEDALLSENSVVTELPQGTVEYAVSIDGKTHAATGFLGTDSSSTNPSQMIDMGRFMQRVEIPQVTYNSSAVSGGIQFAAMPRHFVLTQRFTANETIDELSASFKLNGDAFSQYDVTVPLEGDRAISIRNDAGDGWSLIIPEQDGVTSAIARDKDGAVTINSTFNAVSAADEVSHSLIAVPSTAGGEDQVSVWLYPGETVEVQYVQLNRDGTDAGELSAATWDAERGVYLIPLGNLSDVGAPSNPDWTDPDQHNWYNRHRLVIENENSEDVSIPLAFDGGNNAAFYIVGGSPILRDMNGEPIGAPIQISKNWHESPFWYHLYTALNVANGTHELEHTFAHSKWGEAYAAAHAQLSLIGWGYNQQWDESSLGAFGETITYDPDLTLSRGHVSDVRPFLVDAAGEWTWTGNVGGASFLVYASADGYQSVADHQLSRLRTHYAYTGPNLTNVMYAGKTRDEKIEAKISTQLGRTDDLVRVYYHLDYTFLQDVSYDRLAFFQIAADRYADNGFTRYAYGNESGVTVDAEVTEHGTTGYASEDDRGIALSGNAPWVMLYENSRDGDSLPEHLANIGFVIRDYEAKLGDETLTTPYINLQRTYNGGYSQIAFELGLPYSADATTVPAGSRLTATIEYLVPPADKSAYYGDSDYLTAMAASDFEGTAMMLRLAEGNQLSLTANVGTIQRLHPPELLAASGDTAVEFTLDGGLGYVPISVHGLTQPDGWTLEQKTGDTWEQVDQAVEGNDYWQAYNDVDSDSYSLIYNVPNRDSTTYRLTRSPE